MFSCKSELLIRVTDRYISHICLVTILWLLAEQIEQFEYSTVIFVKL